LNKGRRDPPILVMITCPSIDISDKIASSLTTKKLAACVNITADMKSIFRWEGKTEEATEKLLIIKSRKGLLPKIIQDTKMNHPYRVPEIIAIPIIGGSKDYLRWLKEETAN